VPASVPTTLGRSASVRRAEAVRRRQELLRVGAASAGVFLVAVGSCVLLGWLLDVRVMRTFGAGLDMKVNTALGLLETGALTALAAVRRAPRAGAWLAAAASVVPALTALEYLAGVSVGIDNVLDVDAAPAADLPGRMAPLTTVGLVAIALALVATFRRRPVTAQIVALVAVVVSLVALVGYLFGVESLYRVQEYTSIAVPTAVSLGVAALAVLALNTSGGILSVVVGETAGGVVARALLPPIVLFQVLVGGLALWGVTGGLFDERFGFALVAVGNIVGGVVLVLVLSYALRMSDLRRAGVEAALVQAHEESAELAAANAVLEDFAAMAAHDLRRPIAAVRGYAELLEDGLDDAERTVEAQRDLVARIQTAARRGNEMITDILAFARIGAQALELEEVDLAAEISSVADELEAFAQRPVDLVLGDLPRLRSDRSLVRLIAANILTNAANYVPPDRHARVVVEVLAEDGHVVIGFADNGDGIAVADRGRLMRMFERGAASSRVPGTGIGLAICARAAEVLGGRFWVEDGPGGGARFCLALPVAH
jgi:signal transduction histidine kinase